MIRAVDLSDEAVLDEVFTVQRLGYAVEAEIIGFDRIPGLVESKQDLAATQHEFLGYYDEDGLAGCIAFVHKGSELDICRLFVHPRAFRGGVASQLIDALPPAEHTIVSTGSNNTPALRLYRKHGFVTVNQREVAPGVSITELARVTLRPAKPDDVETLTELALAAKQHWGYDQAFMDAVRDELTFTADDIAERHFVVAELQGDVVGFYSVDGEPPRGELGNMWAKPSQIGTGLGAILWRHAMSTAAELGHDELDIDSEPFAEGFYLRMGAERVGEIASGSIPGRVLPQLRTRTKKP